MTIASPASLPDNLFATRAPALQDPDEWPDGSGKHEVVSLSYGLADPALFPREDLVDALAGVLADDAAEALNYGPSYAGLTELVAARLRRKGIATATAARTVITYGSSQVLGLLPHIFVDPGDTVLIEAPTFLGAVRQFQDGGARCVGVPVDAHGMNTDALGRTLAQLAADGIHPKFLYTIPTYQNPTGATMPLERRQHLLALARKYNIVVIEDDAYSDLRFEGESAIPLAGLDEDDRVVYVGTFSKILVPGVRMGWACGRPEIIERLRLAKVEGGSGPLMTRLVARYCADGRLDAHIAELVRLYRTKRDVMLHAIATHLPPNVQITRPEGGFFIWATLPPGVSATALLQRAEPHGVTFLPGTACYADGSGDDCIRLAFSLQPADAIERGIAALGVALREMQA